MRNGKHYPPKFASPNSWARPGELRNPRDTLTAPPRTLLQDYASDAYGTQSKTSGYLVVIVVVAIPRLRGLEHISSILARMRPPLKSLGVVGWGRACSRGP